jgi:dipeptidase E
MKLLLTSAGIQNKSIAKAILDLVGLPVDQIKVVFVPTAANVEKGEKLWLINDLLHFKEQNYGQIDIVDIAAVSKEIWLPRLQEANLLCFGGGNEQFLARVMQESGLRDELPNLLESRVYMGISAGSMIAGQFLAPDLLKVVYSEDSFEGELHPALGLVDCNFIPHLNSPWFPQSRKEVLQSLKSKNPLYALDDQSALKIFDENIEVISEGEFFKI